MAANPAMETLGIGTGWHSARRGRVGFANNGIWGEVFNARATHGPRGRRSHATGGEVGRIFVARSGCLYYYRVIVPTNTNRPARLVIASPRAFAPRPDGRPLRLPAPTAAVSRKPPLSSVYRGPRNRRPRTTLAPQLASLHANPRPRSLPCSAASRRPQRGPAQAASPLATSFAGHRPRAVPRAAATDPPPEQPLRRRQPVPDPRRAPTSLPFVSAARSPIHAEHRGTSLLGTSPAPRCYPHGGLPPPSREPPSSALRTWRAPARVPGFRRRLATCAPGFRCRRRRRRPVARAPGLRCLCCRATPPLPFSADVCFRQSSAPPDLRFLVLYTLASCWVATL